MRERKGPPRSRKKAMKKKEFRDSNYRKENGPLTKRYTKRGKRTKGKGHGR